MSEVSSAFGISGSVVGPSQSLSLPEGSKPIGRAAGVEVQNIEQFQNVLNAGAGTAIGTQSIGPTPTNAASASAPNFLTNTRLSRAESILVGMHQSILQKELAVGQSVKATTSKPNPSPAELLKVQQATTEYSQNIDFITNLSKKFTDTVSTLLRSQ
jgi:hypothetical protein